jgi:hypothetical protein
VMCNLFFHLLCNDKGLHSYYLDIRGLCIIPSISYTQGLVLNISLFA